MAYGFLGLHILSLLTKYNYKNKQQNFNHIMSKDQLNKNYETALNQCRSQIDAIDDKILSLLGDRIKIVENVRHIKQANGEGLFIKSAREADMIKDLLAKAAPELTKSTIISIWRKIITSSNVLEQNLQIALHNPQKISDYNYLLREYYSDSVPIISHDSAANVILDIENKKAQIAIFALPDENNNADNWWINLANNKSGIKVFALIPFSKTANKINLVALAVKEQEKSSDDNSLLCIDISSNLSRSDLAKALKESEIDAKIIKSAQLKNVQDVAFYLVEARGFFDQNSPQIAALKKHKIKPFVNILGVYPNL